MRTVFIYHLNMALETKVYVQPQKKLPLPRCPLFRCTRALKHHAGHG